VKIRPHNSKRAGKIQRQDELLNIWNFWYFQKKEQNGERFFIIQFLHIAVTR